MFNKKLVVGGLLAAVGSLGIVGGVWAYQGDPSKTGPNHTPERETAIEKAIKAGDYQAWKGMMTGRGRVTEAVNADNFSRFAEAWKLSRDGKTREADIIRKELGLRTGDGARGRRGEGRRGAQGRRGTGFSDLNNDGICDHRGR